MIKSFLFAVLILCNHPLGFADWKADLQEQVDKSQLQDWEIDQIQNDLRAFAKEGISSEMLDATIAKATSLYSVNPLARFLIKNNCHKVIFCDPVLQQHERLIAVSGILELLCQTVKMPDVDFIVCLGDAADYMMMPGPIFAFSKSIHSQKIIVMPNYCALLGIDGLLEEVDAGILLYPWANKIDKACWRGATTGGDFSFTNFLEFPRSIAVLASLMHPSYIDARYNTIVQCEDPKALKKHYKVFFGESFSVKDHLKYKYQLLIDGNTCAWTRALWQLYSNSLVIKPASPHLEWYYGGLIPYLHYLPINENFDDVIEKIQWARSHEDESLAMIQNAQRFVKDHLLRASANHYFYQLLVAYAHLQHFNH